MKQKISIKSALIILTFIFSGSIATAQYQSYFGANSTHWKTINVSGITPENGSLDSLAFVGEIEYSNSSYHVFEVFSWDAGWYPNNWFVSTNDPYQPGVFLWMREDENNATLYMDWGTAQAPDGFEVVVSNMNLTVGESHAGLTVTSVETDDAGRKVIFLEGPSGNNKMIEGVGADWFTGQSETQLIVCQSKDDELMYEHPDEVLSIYCAGIPLSTNPESENLREFNLFPNPATDKITVQLQDFTEPNAFSIYTPLGQEVMNGNLTQSRTEIDLSTLPNGMYLIRMGESLRRFLVVGD